MGKNRSRLTSLDDLRPAPYNPRAISADAREGLGHSLDYFGDLAGIVWNARSGHLIAGHQRVAVLRERGAVLDAFIPALVLDGRTFPVRIVDWDADTERAANVAANNPHIAGHWTDDLQVILEDLQAADFPEFDDLRLGELLDEPPPDLGDGEGDGDGGGDGDDGGEKEKADAGFQVGPYRFTVERERFFEWLEEMRQKVGFDNEAVIAEVKRRLRL